jgi:hypothetical protein
VVVGTGAVIVIDGVLLVSVVFVMLMAPGRHEARPAAAPEPEPCPTRTAARAPTVAARARDGRAVDALPVPGVLAEADVPR